MQLFPEPRHQQEEATLQSSTARDREAAEKLSSRLQESGTAAHLVVRHSGTDKQTRNRQAQARYRERLRVMARQPVEEFVVDPHKHSVEVVRQCGAGEILPFLKVHVDMFQHCTQLLGWDDPCATLTDDLCTFLVKWTVALRAAMRMLLDNYTARPCMENLNAITPFTCQLRQVNGIYWHSMLEGHAWPQTIVSAYCATITATWGKPASDNHIKQCVEAMKLTLQQKANIVEAFRKWQQQTAAAQHRSAHILPGMRALQHKRAVSMEFSDRAKNEQVLRECEIEQKRAAAQLHSAYTNEIAPVQWGQLVLRCQPFARDALKLCEAIERSLAHDTQQAVPQHSRLQPAACSLQLAEHGQPEVAADSEGPVPAGLLADTDLDDILRDLSMSVPAGSTAGPVRQNSWELRDLDLRLEPEDWDPLMGALVA
ncbi:hypothetical protein WJX73_004500 [Symbiochloris irregularis]|uniref:Uncharacterized protein n=1 Tax=Symbiochloris irregularis TaxID=706552 RepID=A0AAW1PK49_9CHLO